MVQKLFVRSKANVGARSLLPLPSVAICLNTAIPPHSHRKSMAKDEAIIAPADKDVDGPLPIRDGSTTADGKNASDALRTHFNAAVPLKLNVAGPFM